MHVFEALLAANLMRLQDHLSPPLRLLSPYLLFLLWVALAGAIEGRDWRRGRLYAGYYRLLFLAAALLFVFVFAALVFAERLGDAANREIVGFRPARGENDLGRVGPDQGGQPRARDVEVRFGPLPEGVHAGGVAEIVGQDASDGLENRRVEGRRGVVVEVDPHDCRRS